MMRLLKQIIKSHYIDLIIFYGSILVMMVPFVIWYFTMWGMAGSMFYLGVVQFTIFTGLFVRFTTDLLMVTTNIQYCLAPIKQGEKIIAPLLFYAINFILADLLVLLLVISIHFANLGSLANGFIQIFILSSYVMLIVTLALFLSVTMFNRFQIKIPAIINDKINAKQFYSFMWGFLATMIGVATLAFSQTVGKILITPLFVVSIPVSNYISNSTLKVSINTLPYMLLGLIYIYLIVILSERNAYVE